MVTYQMMWPNNSALDRFLQDPSIQSAHVVFVFFSMCVFVKVQQMQAM